MPFFILVSFLQALVLLNLIIAVMGDTYERVCENRQSVDAKERLSLIYEYSLLSQTISNCQLCRKRKRNHCKIGSIDILAPIDM